MAVLDEVLSANEAYAASLRPLVLVGFCPHWLGYLPEPFDLNGYEESLSYGPALVAFVRDELVRPSVG